MNKIICGVAEIPVAVSLQVYQVSISKKKIYKRRGYNGEMNKKKKKKKRNMDLKI